MFQSKHVKGVNLTPHLIHSDCLQQGVRHPWICLALSHRQSDTAQLRASAESLWVPAADQSTPGCTIKSLHNHATWIMEIIVVYSTMSQQCLCHMLCVCACVLWCGGDCLNMQTAICSTQGCGCSCGGAWLIPKPPHLVSRLHSGATWPAFCQLSNQTCLTNFKSASTLLTTFTCLSFSGLHFGLHSSQMLEYSCRHVIRIFWIMHIFSHSTCENTGYAHSCPVFQYF